LPSAKAKRRTCPPIPRPPHSFYRVRISGRCLSRRARARGRIPDVLTDSCACSGARGEPAAKNGGSQSVNSTARPALGSTRGGLVRVARACTDRLGASGAWGLLGECGALVRKPRGNSAQLIRAFI